MKLAVLYQRYEPYGLGMFAGFLESYCAHVPGVEHDLVVLNHSQAGGSDLGDYRKAMEDIDAEVFCCLNCHSRPLVDGWLERLTEVLSPEVGLVGATGSWESPPFASFPNPHVRSTGFAIRRTEALRLEWDVSAKGEAWELECGRRSLTCQIREMGLEVLVVGRSESYPIERWPTSRTFRSGDQEELLIADNRTNHYQHANPQTRWWLAGLAWGADRRLLPKEIDRWQTS